MRTTTRLRKLCTLFGVDPWRAAESIRFLPRYARGFREYNRLNKAACFPATLRQAIPVFEDFEDEAGHAHGDYFHQDLWAARLIYARRPARHTDVGSRIDGFIAHLLTFMPVEVIDVRPLNSETTGLTFNCEDATKMARYSDDSLDSLSSLHAVEHFGLGRYGDSINPDGSFQAMTAFARVLAPAGRLYLSVPIGRECLRFNGHRIFSPITVIKALMPLRLLSFAAVDAAGRFHCSADPSSFADSRQALGLFEFTK